MIDFFAHYETQLNLVSMLGMTLVLMFKPKNEILMGFLIVIFWSLLMLNTAVNILVKGF